MEKEYGKFLVSVIEHAEKRSQSLCGQCLADRYHISTMTIVMLKKLLMMGWMEFKRFTIELRNCYSCYYQFVNTSKANQIIETLIPFGGEETLLKLYADRVLPIAVFQIGEEYEQRFFQTKKVTQLCCEMVTRLQYMNQIR